MSLYSSPFSSKVNIDFLSLWMTKSRKQLSSTLSSSFFLQPEICSDPKGNVTSLSCSKCVSKLFLNIKKNQSIDSVGFAPCAHCYSRTRIGYHKHFLYIYARGLFEFLKDKNCQLILHLSGLDMQKVSISTDGWMNSTGGQRAKCKQKKPMHI